MALFIDVRVAADAARDAEVAKKLEDTRNRVL